MSGFVVCTKCGTRIKAGREFCLKCFEPLPDPDTPARPPVWESLGLSRNTEITIGVGAAIAAAALVFVIWQTQPETVDDAVQPVGPVVRRTAEPAPAPSLTPASAPSIGEAPADADPALESARAGFEQRLTAVPNDADLHHRLAQVLERQGKTDEGLKHFERAVALAPLNSGYRTSFARAASTAGQWDRAIDQYREAARLLPGDYVSQYALALAIQKKGDHQVAIPEFLKATKLNPKDPAASLGLAVSLEKTGQVDESIDEYRRFLDLKPPPPDEERIRAHLALLTRGRK